MENWSENILQEQMFADLVWKHEVFHLLHLQFLYFLEDKFV